MQCGRPIEAPSYSAHSSSRRNQTLRFATEAKWGLRSLRQLRISRNYIDLRQKRERAAVRRGRQTVVHRTPETQCGAETAGVSHGRDWRIQKLCRTRAVAGG